MSHAFQPKRYPTSPGCYLMKDATGRVIYVGKAKDLRKRLSSYFNDGWKHGRTRRLVERIDDIEVILVNSEVESLILENNLIKRYKPRFNVLLKSEAEGYPYIVQTDEDFPRFVPFKKHRVNWALDGMDQDAITRRFGPYPGWRFRNTLLDYVNETFLLRQCHPLPAYACLLHHMHKCSAPCEKLVEEEAYAQAVKRAAKFLAHPPASAVHEMRQRMNEHAERLEFERAARIREQLKVMERALSWQIVERDVKHDQDVLWFGDDGTVTALTLKHGALLAVSTERWKGSRVGYVRARYAQQAPAEVLLNMVQQADGISAELTHACGHKVKVHVPRAGIGLALLKLAQRNHNYRAGLVAG